MRHHCWVGVLRRVWRQPRPEVVAVVAVILVLVVIAALAWSRVSPHRAAGVDRLGVQAAPADSTAPDAPPPDAPPTTAPTKPSPSPHSLASALDTPAAAATDLPASADPAGRPASAPTDPTECVGPLPPGHPAEPACDVGKHTGIPTDCRPMTGCGWWDAWGATPGGPGDMGAHPTDTGQIAVTWATSGDDITGDKYIGPLRGFLVRICEDDGSRVLQQYELGVGRRSLTTTNLAPGTYTVWVAEINDSGYSGGLMLQHIAAGNSATSQPTPAPTTTTP